MPEILATLMFAHYVGDFPMQGDFLGVYKAKYDYLLFVHTFIWTGCIVIALLHLNIFAMWKVIFLFVGHFLIDRLKCRKEDKTNALTSDLWLDQTLHFGQLALVTIL